MSTVLRFCRKAESPFVRGHCIRMISRVAVGNDTSQATAAAPKTALSTTVPVAQAHYEHHSAQSYESSYFYEAGAYTNHLSELVRDTLRISKKEQTTKIKKLLDIGGGTGNFTQMLVKDAQTQAIVVDPFLETSTNGEVDSVRFVKAAAEEFMTDPTPDSFMYRKNYDQVLMKEVAHHFRSEDRVGIFRGLYDGMNPQHDLETPSLLLITRPQHDIDYPLWDEARDVWAKNQPSFSRFIDELQQAGFRNVKLARTEAYPCSIGLKRWQNMIKTRFWSTFANFSDDQLESAAQGIALSNRHRITNEVEIVSDYNKKGTAETATIHFEDRLLFVVATKAGS